jgi:putative Ca2+/H+ antiporter (TMEM165/GDT1 family)
MNWKLLLVTFGTVFLAELGDKTQLATLAFAAANRSFWSVFLGSALALVTASLAATLLGSFLARCLPARWVSLGAGVLFIIIGAILVARNLRPAC